MTFKVLTMDPGDTMNNSLVKTHYHSSFLMLFHFPFDVLDELSGPQGEFTSQTEKH